MLDNRAFYLAHPNFECLAMLGPIQEQTVPNIRRFWAHVGPHVGPIWTHIEALWGPVWQEHVSQNSLVWDQIGSPLDPGLALKGVQRLVGRVAL